MNVKQIVLPGLSAILLFSCVSSKKFKKSQADYATLQAQHTQVQGDLSACNDEKANLQFEIHLAARGKNGWRCVAVVGLAPRPADRRPADYDRARTAVIAHG